MKGDFDWHIGVRSVVSQNEWLLITNAIRFDVVYNRFPVQMKIGTVETTVEVMAESPVVDTTRSEEVSLVDEVLRADPLFAQMDFVTRDRYRHGLEELAKGSRRQELEVARLVIAKAEHARIKAIESDETADWRLLDPGYYLISRGRPAFEAEIGFRPSLRRRVLRWYIAHATPAFLGSVVLATLLLTVFPLLETFRLRRAHRPHERLRGRPLHLHALLEAAA